jgi:hypothetical protein
MKMTKDQCSMTKKCLELQNQSCLNGPIPLPPFLCIHPGEKTWEWGHGNVVPDCPVPMALCPS